MLREICFQFFQNKLITASKRFRNFQTNFGSKKFYSSSQNSLVVHKSIFPRNPSKNSASNKQQPYRARLIINQPFLAFNPPQTDATCQSLLVHAITQRSGRTFTGKTLHIFDESLFSHSINLSRVVSQINSTFVVEQSIARLQFRFRAENAKN